MRNTLATAVVLLALTMVATPGIQAQELDTFIAELHGGNQPPPIATGAYGRAELILDRNLWRVDCKVSVWSSPPVSAAHIHLGSAGSSGPVVIKLSPPSLTGDGSWHCDFDLQDLIPKPDRGVGNARDLEEILSFNDGHNLYVNVHTSENPAGEIRGQLVRQ